MTIPFFQETAAAEADWTIVVSTIAAALAAIAALASLAYAGLTARRARRDRLLEQLQRITELLIRIKNAALSPAHEWGQHRDFFRQSLIMTGYLQKWDSCSRLAELENPVGDTPQDRKDQLQVAQTAARLAECALKDVSLEIEGLVRTSSRRRSWRNRAASHLPGSED